MKKVIIFILICLLIISCSSIVHYDNTHTQDIEIIDNAYKFNYEGHDYIMFYHNSEFGQGFATGVVHSPDCICYTDGRYIDYD